MARRLLLDVLGDEAEEVVAYLLGLVEDGRSSGAEDANLAEEVFELIAAHDTAETPVERLRDVSVQVVEAAGNGEAPLAPEPAGRAPAPAPVAVAAKEGGVPVRASASPGGRRGMAAGAAKGVTARESEASGGPAEEQDSSASLELCAMMQSLVPGASDDICRYLIDLHGPCDEAVDILLSASLDDLRLEMQTAAARKAAAAAANTSAEKTARKNVMHRYAQVAEKTDPSEVTKLEPPRLPYTGSRKEIMNTKVQRYRNGESVGYSKEKFVEEKKEEWDGGSRGKVKTKGKRGPAYVAG